MKRAAYTSMLGVSRAGGLLPGVELPEAGCDADAASYVNDSVSDNVTCYFCECTPVCWGCRGLAGSCLGLNCQRLAAMLTQHPT
jgi:hypothetical protein